MSIPRLVPLSMLTHVGSAILRSRVVKAASLAVGAAIGAYITLKARSIYNSKIPQTFDTLADELLATVEAEFDNLGHGEIQGTEEDDNPLVLLRDSPDGLKTRRSRRVRKRKEYFRHLVNDAKVKFSVYRYADFTEANRLCVRRHISDQMRDHGVRPSHMMAILDRAVAMVFIPSRGEVEFGMLRASRPAAERDMLVEGGWWRWVNHVSGMVLPSWATTLPERE